MFYKPVEIVKMIEYDTRDILEILYYQLKDLPNEEEKKKFLISVKNKVNESFDLRLNMARFE